MGVKKYLKNEFQLQNFFLEHDNVSDFSVTSWQRNRSSLSLLCLRTLIFIGCAATWISSMVITVPMNTASLWFIFMTNWGVMFNTFASGFAVCISAMTILKGSGHSNFGLPWYVKAYWVLINISLTVAIFITLFYWSLLTDFAGEDDYEMETSPVLNVFEHAINSVFMLALLVCSRHPMRMLHFYFPLLVGIIYLVFTVIFHFAGGISPLGESWIYPMLDWAKPGQTSLLALVSAVTFVVIHALVVGIAVARDAITKRCRDSTLELPNTDDCHN